MDELEQAVAEAEAAGKALVAMTAGFVTATLRAITVAGRVATDPPEPIVYEQPDVPANLAEVTKGSTFYTVECDVALSNDAYPVLGYQFEENGVLLPQQSSTTFSRSGRAPSTAHSIRVRSFTFGATSDWSSAIVVTTDASGGVEPTPDTTAPTVPIITSLVANSSTSATVTITGSTDAESGVAYYVVHINDNPVTPIVPPNLSATWGSMYPGTLNRFSVSAVDNAGNESARSTEVSITMPGTVVIPPAPRTFVGAVTDGALLTEGAIGYVGPAPPARAVVGAMSTGVQTASGLIANVPGGTANPTWVTPSVDTTYDYTEGDLVNIPLAATDYNAQPATLSAYQMNLPPNVALDIPGRRLYGTLAVGTGATTPAEYDNYVLASDAAVSLPSITTTSLSSATVGVAYSATIATTGGTAPRFLTIVSMVPTPTDTWTLNPSTGALTCTATEPYTGTINLSVTDALSNVGYASLSIVVNQPSTGTADPEEMWQLQRSAPGVMLAKRLDNSTDILGDGEGPGLLQNGAFDAGLWALDTAVKAHGAGSMRFDLTAASTGGTGMNWCHYLDGAGDRRFYQVGDEFWVQVMVRLNDAACRHYMLTTGDAPGHKIFIIDRFKRTAGVKEAVILNSRARSYPSSYLGLSVSQAWGNGSVQRPVPGTSDYYRHPAFDAGTPDNPTTYPTRQQRYGPVIYNGVSNSYQGPTGRGAGIPDPNIGSFTFTPDEWCVITVRIKINSLTGQDGIYQVWAGDYLGDPKLLISQENANFRCSTVETKSVDDTTPGNLGYSGLSLVFFQTDLAADPGRDTMSVWYQQAITSLGPPQHPGATGLVTLPGILDG